MTRIGISLDLLLSSLPIISSISCGLQSSRNSEFLLEGMRNSSKDLKFESDRPELTIESFNLLAIELKYLLNCETKFMFRFIYSQFI